MSTIFNDEIVRPDFRLEGPHLVAASAGTGKTYNIQNIYARLILEKGLRVSEIQVMTFTEPATRELRERLRTVLKDILARFENRNCDGKDDKDIARRNTRADQLLACAQDHPAARANLELALLEYDNAAISTIHGFCNRALSRYAFETGMTFRPEIRDDKQAVLARMARDWWRTKRPAFPKAIQNGLNFGTLQGFISALSGKTDWNLDIPEANSPASVMLQAAEDIIAQYEASRQNSETQTFDDILRLTRKALKGPFGAELAKKLRTDFKAALIDEFQDTDPVQYDIFKQVFLANPDFPVYFVGDPKQAIYAFRGGDIFTYRKAVTEDIPNGSKYHLDTNFRSTKRLMDAVNALFHDDTANDNITQYTFGDSAIDYSEDVKASDQKGLAVNGHEDSSPFRIITVKDGKNAELFRSALAQEVIRTLEEHTSLTPKDLAILVKSHDEGSLIARLLKSRGVPCVVEKPGSVFLQKGDEFNAPWHLSRLALEYHSILLAMARPADAQLVRSALMTVFFGYTAQELLDLTETALAQWISRFHDMNNAWLTRGFPAAVSKMEEQSIREGLGVRERMAAQPDGERMLADYLQMLELSFAAVKTQGAAPETLISWLEERGKQANDEADAKEFARELESEHDAVKIMTMHYSKGLQFPVVFLPDCDLSARTPKEGELRSYHDPDGRLTFSLIADNGSIEEENQEKLRLLYVAMTRAQQRTVVFLRDKACQAPLQRLLDNAAKHGAGRQDDDSPILWLDDYAVESPAPTYRATVENLTLKQENTLPEYDLRPTKGSYSFLSPALHAGKAAEDGLDMDADDQADSPDTHDSIGRHPIFHIPGGAVIGSCWHAILEETSFAPADGELEEISREALLNYGFDADRPVSEGYPSIFDVTVDMIRKTLDCPMATCDGTAFTLADIPWEHRLSEQEFNFPSAHARERTSELAAIIRRHWADFPDKEDFLKQMENWDRPIPKGFINGFMDLVIRKGDAYYVLDWKSNSLGGDVGAFTPDGLRHEMATHGYFFQYLLYAAVLHAHLKTTLGKAYSWERHFGGIRYCFLRGIAANGKTAVFSDRPDCALLDELGRALGMED